jgi:hypothetical protein
MAVANWNRLRQSEVMDYGGELPARVVIDRDEDDHSYRTFVETVSPDGKPASSKGMRFFYWEKEALEDYMKLVRAARKGVGHRQRA